MTDQADWTERLLGLQRALAQNPRDQDVRSQLCKLLEEAGAEPAAFNIPTGANLGDMGAWYTWWPALQRKAWFSLNAGNDSNITSGTELASIQIPLVNYRSLVVDEPLRQKSSNFLLLQTGAKFALATSYWWTWEAEARGAWRYNANNFEYFPHSYALGIAGAAQIGPSRWRLSATGEQHWLASYQVVISSGTKLDVEWPLSSVLLLRAESRQHEKQYPAFQGVQTVDRSYGLQVAGRRLGSAVLIDAGDESSPQSLSDMDRQYFSRAARLNVAVFSRGLATLECRRTDISYKKPSPLFLVTREDQNTACYLGYRHALGKGWSWGPSFVRETNTSSLALMKYERTQVLIGARKDF